MKQFLRCLATHLMALTLSVALTACGGSDNNAPTDDGSTNTVPGTGTGGTTHTSLTGDWSCNVKLYAYADSKPVMDENVALQLHQSDGMVTGMLEEIPLTGTVRGRTVDIIAPGDNATWYMRGEFNSNLTVIIGGDLQVDAPPGTSWAYGSWRAWR